MIRRDFAMFVSYRTALFSHLLTIVFSVTMFYYVSRLVSGRAFATSDKYFAFVVIGLVILRVLTAALQATSTSLRQELVAGTLERLVVSPFGPVAGLMSMVAFPFLLSLGLSVLTLVFATVAFGVDIQWSTAPLAIPVAVLGALAFAPFSYLLAAVVVLFKQAAGGAAVAIVLISLVAGLYYPVSLLPGWIAWTSEVQPFTPAVDLLRHLLVGTPLKDGVAVDVIKLMGFTVVLMPISAFVLASAVRAARRRATIIEY